MTKSKSNTVLTGAAGEHFVVSKLLRRGYVAALAPSGSPNTDIVVTDITGNRLCSIQVKTRRALGSDGGWHMSKKHESIVGERLFYCFVDLGESVDSFPRVHVIPSEIVASVLTQMHMAWLAVPGANGQQRKDSNFRRLVPDYTRSCAPNPTPYSLGWLEPYREAWHLLELD